METIRIQEWNETVAGTTTDPSEEEPITVANRKAMRKPSKNVSIRVVLLLVLLLVNRGAVR
jgi:hypothetical protein